MKRGLIIICVLMFGITGCKDFLNLVIKEIVVVDARITEITFQNGLTHKFLYRE